MKFGPKNDHERCRAVPRRELLPLRGQRSGRSCFGRKRGGSHMKAALDLFTIAMVAAGAFFFLAGTAGLLRFPDTFSRLHALTKADNLGLALIVLGLMPHVNGVLPALKLVLVWLLVLLASAGVSQLIAQAARRRQKRP
jgi:multicomponent Na+:H+ antiporter subunit G